MDKKSHFKLLSPLLSKPFFTSFEARKLGVSSGLLNHYIKTGRLKRIQRGIYQSVEYQSSAISLWEDLIQAASSVSHGVICLLSALSVYELTDEIPRQHWIGIRHGTSVKRSRQIRIIRFRNFELGKTEIDLDGTSVPIFDRERTIIDTFRLLSREIAIKALRTAIGKGGKNRLDIAKLEKYAKKLRFDITPYLLSVTT